ncbi:MAG TPA: GTPase HflX [Verrucomicrobiae bacterium]|nr:GTPase HflX [Verrucomicrobiae bacterium]
MHNADKTALLITYPNPFTITEAKALAESTGYSIIDTICQKHITRSKFGIGKGKAEVVREKIMELKPDVIIFDEVLKPSQQYNLSKLCRIEVIDREKLILEIFLNRAATNESKIQVKIAQLKYDIVRVKEKVRLSKGGGEEQPGFLGVGKYDADLEILSIKRRSVILKKKLLVEEKKRNLHRNQRLIEKSPLISLTGYTSAGKTSLFNIITNEKKETDKQLFTTLTTFTRAAFIDKRKVLFTDTIGFISKLPAYMIEAFKSTLSEINFAEVVLLVIDFSDDTNTIKEKLKSSLETLSMLQVPNNKLILVLNKVDLVKQSEITEKLKDLNLQPDMNHIVPISSKTGYNIPLLLDKINLMLGVEIQED